jgi:methionine sulfoxide reductase heme-binding subunit
MSHALWYLSRATGIVSMLVLSLVVVLGAVMRKRGRLPGLPRNAGVGLHRNASLFAVVLIAIHVLTAILDPYVAIGWLAVVVPFTSHYEPLWLGLGALAIDMVIAVVITSLLRFRIGIKTWRAVHWLAYAAWPVAVMHGIGASTDLRSGRLLSVVLATVAGVALTIAWRAAEVPPAKPATPARA